MTDRDDPLRVSLRARRLFMLLLETTHRAQTETPAEMIAASEMLASLARRLARDLGAPKDAVVGLRSAASREVGEAYEASGTGRKTRELRRRAEVAQAMSADDSKFTQQQRDAAAVAATEAIRRAMEGT